MYSGIPVDYIKKKQGKNINQWVAAIRQWITRTHETFVLLYANDIPMSYEGCTTGLPLITQSDLYSTFTDPFVWPWQEVDVFSLAPLTFLACCLT